jgi:hypothetical protein
LAIHARKESPACQAISVSDGFLEKGEIVSTRGRNAEETQRFNARSAKPSSGRATIRRAKKRAAVTSGSKCETGRRQSPEDGWTLPLMIEKP